MNTTRNAGSIVLSLCDHSGNWSRGFAEAGYTVVRVDPKHDGRDTTEGTEILGSGSITRADDGAFLLSMTAGQLADLLQQVLGAGISPAQTIASLITDAGHWMPFTVNVSHVLAAPPCTHFSSSGARHWPGKDADGRTAAAVRIVQDCLRVVRLCQPRVWALENPVGRIARLVPELASAPAKLVFDPCDYANYSDDASREAYTKRTCIWGQFDQAGMEAAKNRVEPVMVELTRKDGSKVRGSWMWAKLGGKSERTKQLRSVTPIGFSTAFRWWNV